MSSAGVFVLSMLAAVAASSGPSPSPAASPSPQPNEAVVETAAGSFVIRLLPDLAPAHVKHFIKTARAGGYDGTTFHRIVTRGIIQGGDPLTKDPRAAARYGTGGLGLLKAEFSDRAFTRGTVAAARRPSGKDTGGSQFFVVVTDQPSLKGQYTIFGEVVTGMEVVDKISDTPVDGDRPRERVEMKVRLRSDP
jgi:peptidyl-prolyl cis-trans isomerase B (cyclophilin B)